MSNEIKTRISLRYDTFAKWQTSNLILNAGEVGFCTVDDTATATTAPTVLFKVGDGEHKFSELKWASATAADVYGWAKTAKAEDVTVKAGSGESVETKTLQKWFEDVQRNTAAIAALDIPDTADINGLINTALDKLVVTDPVVSNNTTSTEFISSVSQTNGKITATKAKLPEASTNIKGIVQLGVTGGAATFEAVNTLSAEVAGLKSSVAGGVHFIGITTTAIADGSTTKSITIDGKSVSASAGDIVLYSEKEFIWTGTIWEELGDLSRVSALETWRQGLTVADTVSPKNFVTAVTQTDGKITVSRAQPTTDDIKHEASTLAAYLAERFAAVNDTINNLDVNDPTASGNATTFINTIKQENGKIVATKANLPTADDTTAGIVKLGVEGGAAAYAVTTKVANIESDYIRYNSTNNKLYLGTSGSEEIIFNCGGAE